MIIYLSFRKYMIFTYLLIPAFSVVNAQELYKAPDDNTHTRWVSPENPGGKKGEGGQTNQGAKGNAYFIVPPGEKQELMNVKGPGIIKRMWMSGTIARSPEQMRAVRIDMYWDGASKPAVSAPIGDFFGLGLGHMVPFDSELFASPEGRSFNFTIPMPFRSSARIEITNESSDYVLIWYDINYLVVDKLDDDALYFHAYWHRNFQTELGKDHEILPGIKGKGRYLGANLGVIGDSLYSGTWFGEGEVKIFLDGDKDLPTLVGTGTEDYIGSGWGQGQYDGRHFGSLVANKENTLYAFYRYHVADPVYFHSDIRVTIQQMGATVKKTLLKMQGNGAEFKPVWVLEQKNGKPVFVRLLDMNDPPLIENDDFKEGRPTGFYRRDDVCSTAYFYLDSPENDLPDIAPLDVRMKYMEEKVWEKLK